jgi:hypothetical protein
LAIRIFFFLKNHTPPPFKLNGRSLMLFLFAIEIENLHFALLYRA